MVAPLLDAVEVTAADRVVDVATGAGIVAAAAVRRGAAVTGLDFSAEQLRRARADHPEIAVACADAGALPLVSSSVDAVVSSFGMPHFPDPEAFLRECARVLRPAGHLAFTVGAPPDRSPTFAAVFGALAQHGRMNVGLPPGPDLFRRRGRRDRSQPQHRRRTPVAGRPGRGVAQYRDPSNAG